MGFAFLNLGRRLGELSQLCLHRVSVNLSKFRRRLSSQEESDVLSSREDALEAVLLC